MNLIRTYLTLNLIMLSMVCVWALPAQSAVPNILLAHIYHDDIDVREYLVSEKLDGVRAVWDGHSLTTRQGNPINAPKWFTQEFPNQALDGELWMGRGTFEQVSGTVRKDTPDDEAWRKVTYQLFELPNAQGDFQTRAREISRLVTQSHSPYLKAVEQRRVANQTVLKKWLQQVVALHGEGLMLHRADALYVTGRSQVLLKLKPYLDAEAKVIAYVAGKGKYQGKMGALLVETPEGIRFKLGTGFSDAERANPPPIGALVTYTYNDFTQKGKPKFARFLRVRDEK